MWAGGSWQVAVGGWQLSGAAVTCTGKNWWAQAGDMPAAVAHAGRVFPPCWHAHMQFVWSIISCMYTHSTRPARWPRLGCLSPGPGHPLAPLAWPGLAYIQIVCACACKRLPEPRAAALPRCYAAVMKLCRLLLYYCPAASPCCPSVHPAAGPGRAGPGWGVQEHMLRVFERKEVARKPGVVDAAMDAVVVQPDSDEDEDEDK